MLNWRTATFKTLAGDVDLLSDAEGIPPFEELEAQALTISIFGLEVKVASIDHMIAMKRFVGRPKDLAHDLELLALKKIYSEEETS